MLNNDTEVRPDTARHLVEDGSGFVTAVGSEDPKCVEPPWKWTQTNAQTGEKSERPAMLWPAPDPLKKRSHPDFSAYLIRREVFEKVGPFDENFHGAYAEDSDFHLRMHQAGIEAICLDLPFLHYGAQTIKQASEAEANAISKQADANRAYFKQKHGVEVGSKEYYALFGHGEPK